MDPRTLCEIFYNSVDRGKPVHLRVKQAGAWQDISSQAFRQAVEEISVALEARGFVRGDRLALLSENRPEWAYVDLAALAAGIIDVPIYTTLTAPQIKDLLNDCQAKGIVVSTPVQAAKIAEIRAQVPALRHVIVMDEVALPDTTTLNALRAQGRPGLSADPGRVRKNASVAQPGDIATILYTSGTTGDPKGVMLTHDNIVSNVLGGAPCVRLDPNDVSLSFLPLCHIFERMGGHYLMLHCGAAIAYAESLEQVPANMQEIRPTVMFSVPRLYEKIHSRVMEAVAQAPPLRQKLFHWAVATGRESFRCRLARRAPSPLLRLRYALADRLVLSKIRARTGGRIRVFVSGGAPLSPQIADFFGSVGFTILEGYGLTETSPVICVNRPDAMKLGTVGPALAGVEVKIAEDGEILTRGRHVMKGYYGQPEATAEAIDPDGWFHTGDIGTLDADGFLAITDRKKDLIVTSGGKKVAPQPIENAIRVSPLVAEIVVIGNRRHFPAALVVPRFETLERWAKEQGLTYTDRQDLVGNAKVVGLYEGLIAEKTPHLAQFERIKKIAVLSKEFSMEGGELTPKLSVRRKWVEQKYRDVIDRLYEGAPAA